MKRIERYLFSQFLSAVMFACLAITIVVWFSQAIRMLSLVINNGGSVWSFVSLMVLLLPTFMPLLLPFSLAVGVLFVYHRLVIESELVVMRAAGFSPAALTKPALYLAGIIALVGYFLTCFLAPIANHEFVRLQYQIRSDLSVLLLHTGSFTDVSQGLTFYARDRGKTGNLEGILIHDTRKAGHPTTIMADSGEMVHAAQGPNILVKHGVRQEMDSATGQLSQLSFDSYMVDLSSLGGDFSQRWVEPRERSMVDLLWPKDKDLDQVAHNRFFAEFNLRLVLPFLAVTFTLIACVGTLTGTFDRRGMMIRVAASALAIVCIEGAVITLYNMTAKQPILAIGLYLVTFGPVPFLYRRLVVDRPLRPARLPPLVEPAT
jgi:lipopolysaccharide export system permease protein